MNFHRLEWIIFQDPRSLLTHPWPFVTVQYQLHSQPGWPWPWHWPWTVAFALALIVFGLGLGLDQLALALSVLALLTSLLISSLLILSLCSHCFLPVFLHPPLIRLGYLVKVQAERSCQAHFSAFKSKSYISWLLGIPQAQFVQLISVIFILGKSLLLLTWRFWTGLRKIIIPLVVWCLCTCYCCVL